MIKTEKNPSTDLQSNACNREKTLTVQKTTDSEMMTTNYNWEFVIKIGYCESSMLSLMLTSDQKSKLDVEKLKKLLIQTAQEIIQGCSYTLITAMDLIILFWNRYA